jgi:hypothetical protein
MKFLSSIKEMRMKNATIVKIQILALVATLAAYTPTTFAQKGKPAAGAKSQSAAAPDAAPKSPCSNQTFCYDTADFTATITQFRTSTDSSGNKVLDAIVHFQNKTDQVLSLGYADGSAESMDDHGNRYELSKNGVRGMGTVTGTAPDAKFVLQPNGSGDARVELQWNPKDQIAGASYELEFSVREMNREDGKQWALGNESLLHYDGLANGSASAAGSPHTPGGDHPDSATASSGAAPSASAGTSVGSSLMSNLTNGTAAATQPCATSTAKAAGAANSTGQSGAADAVSSTSAAITSISSLFGHKKAAPAPAAATNVASATPCTAATNAAAGGAGGGSKGASKANAMAQPAAAATVAAAPAAATPVASAATPAHPVTKPTPTPTPAPAPKTGVVNTALKQPVATPVVVAKAPVTPATAAKKPPVVPAEKKPSPAPTPAAPAASAK